MLYTENISCVFWCIISDMQITSWNQLMKYFQSKFINHIQTNKQKSYTTILNGKVPIGKHFRKGNICSNHLKMCLFHFWWIFFYYYYFYFALKLLLVISEWAHQFQNHLNCLLRMCIFLCVFVFVLYFEFCNM